MIKGTKTFPISVEQAVEERLAKDPALKPLWDDLSLRFRQVFKMPELAFESLRIDRLLKDPAEAERAVVALSSRPEAFGGLRGRTGLLTTRIERLDREKAVRQAPVLAQALREYLAKRALAEISHRREEEAFRTSNAIEIPALSQAAMNALEAARAQFDRGLESRVNAPSIIDASVRAELERFVSAASMRFGEKSFLAAAARDPDGADFARISAGMIDGQRAALKEAWHALCAAQRLTPAEGKAASQSETLHQSEQKGLVI